MHDFTSVEVIEDTCSKHDGLNRITSVLATYPRLMHSELMTHRMFSRNAASSRAVPVMRMLDRVESNPVLPLRWGKNQAGMQAADEDLSLDAAVEAEQIWLGMVQNTVAGVRRLHELGLHKQWANRPLEWFSTITVLITATEWGNFFALRISKDPQPEFDLLAGKIFKALEASKPRHALFDRSDAMNWHLPFISEQERRDHRDAPVFLARISAARAARLSYLNHEGKVPDIAKDLETFEKLVKARPIHASPTEHQAYCVPGTHGPIRNFSGWRQFRCVIEEDWPRGAWGSEK